MEIMEERQVGMWIVKLFGRYGRKASRRVIRYGQNRRKLSRIMKNREYMEER